MNVIHWVMQIVHFYKSNNWAKRFEEKERDYEKIINYQRFIYL